MLDQVETLIQRVETLRRMMIVFETLILKCE